MCIVYKSENLSLSKYDSERLFFIGIYNSSTWRAVKAGFAYNVMWLSHGLHLVRSLALEFEFCESPFFSA